MIKIATAECFTHGKIGRELHVLAQNYDGNFGCEYIKNPKDYGDFDFNELSVTCSLFIPTIEAVVKILNVENPPKPNKLIKGIKVYDDAGDKKSKPDYGTGRKGFEWMRYCNRNNSWRRAW